MTFDEFLKKLEGKIQAIEKEDKPLLLAVKSVMSMQSIRVFLQAKNPSNSLIGIYKGGDIWINPNKAPYNRLRAIPTKGKTGKTQFGTGTSAQFKNHNHKTGYFKNYLTYKKAVGRNQKTLNVDLFLTGDLHRNWANAEIGKPPEAIRLNQHNYIVGLTTENAAKVERYGNVFGLSKNEKETFLRVAQFELKKSLQ